MWKGTGTVKVFLDGATDPAPVLAAGMTITLPDVGVVRGNAKPFAVDWNHDSRKDLIVGDRNGRIYAFLLNLA